MFSDVEEAVAKTIATLGAGLKGIDYSRVRVQAGREGSLVLRDACSRVLAAMGAFPEREQRAMVLWATGFSYRAIGRELGTSDRSVRRWLPPALAKLHARLAEIGLVDKGCRTNGD